jgi:hypothetical protein
MIILVTRRLARPGRCCEHALSACDAVWGQLDLPRLRDICPKSVKNQHGDYPTNGGELYARNVSAHIENALVKATEE